MPHAVTPAPENGYELPALELDRSTLKLKRLLDVAGASVGLACGLPAMAAIGATIALTMGRPVLFRQTRPGLHARPFDILKFRTMRNAHDASGRPLSDEDRLTWLGRFLRATSLDELPELLNVLRGDMSLVGPRPLLTRYLSSYTLKERVRFLVRPGITGLAQISGRNDLPWDERLATDVSYVENLSIREDVRILALTVARVLMRSGVQTNPSGSMLDLDVERQQA